MSLTIRLRNFIEYRVIGLLADLLWPPVSATALIEQEEQVLALAVDGHHELPGGMVKAGETLEECCKREVKEETGFNIQVNDLLDIRTSTDGNKGMHFFFSADIIDGQQDGSWEGDPVFISKDELHDNIWRLHHRHVPDYITPS
jgi:ADP-ribose pyrophosphatase YjhB (NUDIX family)